jgi:hypothetical protein
MNNFLLENIFIFSKTFYIDDTYQWIRKKMEDEQLTGTNIRTKIDIPLLKKIYSTQKMLIGQNLNDFKYKKESNILLIIDDSVGNRSLLKGGYLDKRCLTIRHYNMSAIYSTQIHKGLGP